MTKLKILRYLGASFSENFYGLKRRRKPVIETDRAKAAVGGVSTEEKLRRIDIVQSLLVLVRIFDTREYVDWIKRSCLFI